MHKLLPALFFSFLTQSLLAQPGSSTPLQPVDTAPEWGAVTKSAGDSCGAYFNNYIGLAKTTNVLQEYMRTGDIVDDYYYAGRAQRFSVSQPVEVSGVEFYAYETSPLDSVMVITTLHLYVSATDSLGPEITRDTVYVKHTAFTPVLPNISVKSYFDAPVVMNADFVIAMHSTENEELIIITNDYSINDGNGEAFSYALYMNPAYPADDEWVSAMDYFAADYDYLMSPLVKYDLFTPFTILNDTICPDVVNAGCVSYTQTGNFTNHLYNSAFGNTTTHNRWLWGDGYQNVDLMSACHTYGNPGTYNINLRDTLFRYDYAAPHCVVDVTQPIVALDAPTASFSFSQDGLTADFVNASTNADSAWWNFGDASAGTDLSNPSHNFPSVGVFDVWLYAYNACFVDSFMLQVITDDLGLATPEKELAVYPNPASNYVIVSGLQGETKIEVLNLLGETIATVRTTDSQETISVSGLPTGTYFVKITQQNKQITKKLVIRH